jgi:hypothetical protein
MDPIPVSWTDGHFLLPEHRRRAVPNQPITNVNLGQLSLTGTVGAGGDSVTLWTGSTPHAMMGDNAVNAAAGGQIANFNVYGDGGNSAGGGQASFTSGSTIVTRTRIIYGGTAPPNCVVGAFTGETNNLSFGPNAPASIAAGTCTLVHGEQRGRRYIELYGRNHRRRHSSDDLQRFALRFSGVWRLCTGASRSGLRRSNAASVGRADVAERSGQQGDRDANGQD